jgi:hypothetical protein
MSKRRSLLVTVAAVVLVAIALGSAVGVRIGDDDPPRPSTPTADGAADLDAPAGGSASRDAEPRSGTKQGGGEGEGDGASQESGQESGQPASEQGGIEAAPTPATASDDRESSTTKDGVTVVPEAPGPATESALPDLEPSSGTPSPPAYDPPATVAFARGRLVSGYPARLLPAAPRSAVVSSSVAPSADRVQVALVGRRSSSPASVLSFYRGLIGGYGFREVAVDAVAGASAAAFRRGTQRVVVTVDPGPESTYSVYATLVVGEG